MTGIGSSWGGHYEQARVRQAKLSSFLSARLGAYFLTQHSHWGCSLALAIPNHDFAFSVLDPNITMWSWFRAECCRAQGGLGDASSTGILY